jgi:hypothetical protein
MLTYPSDDCLLARGKYSTLGKERRSQLERARKIANTIVLSASQVMRDCEQQPPVNGEHLNTIGKCLENLTKTRDALVEICGAMEAIKGEAWDGNDET